MSHRCRNTPVVFTRLDDILQRHQPGPIFKKNHRTWSTDRKWGFTFGFLVNSRIRWKCTSIRARAFGVSKINPTFVNIKRKLSISSFSGFILPKSFSNCSCMICSVNISSLKNSLVILTKARFCWFAFCIARVECFLTLFFLFFDNVSMISPSAFFDATVTAVTSFCIQILSKKSWQLSKRNLLKSRPPKTGLPSSSRTSRSSISSLTRSIILQQSWAYISNDVVSSIALFKISWTTRPSVFPSLLFTHSITWSEIESNVSVVSSLRRSLTWGSNNSSEGKSLESSALPGPIAFKEEDVAAHLVVWVAGSWLDPIVEQKGSQRYKQQSRKQARGSGFDAQQRINQAYYRHHGVARVVESIIRLHLLDDVISLLFVTLIAQDKSFWLL